MIMPNHVHGMIIINVKNEKSLNNIRQYIVKICLIGRRMRKIQLETQLNPLKMLIETETAETQYLASLLFDH